MHFWFAPVCLHGFLQARRHTARGSPLGGWFAPRCLHCRASLPQGTHMFSLARGTVWNKLFCSQCDRAGHGVQGTGQVPCGLLPRICSERTKLSGICRRQMWTDVNSQFGLIASHHKRTTRCFSKSHLELSASPTRAGKCEYSRLSRLLRWLLSNLVSYHVISWLCRKTLRLNSCQCNFFKATCAGLLKITWQCEPCSNSSYLIKRKNKTHDVPFATKYILPFWPEKTTKSPELLLLDTKGQLKKIYSGIYYLLNSRATTVEN